MTHPVRLAIAGFGLVGRRHADAIEQSRGAVLVGVIEPSAEGRAQAQKRGVDGWADLEAFLAQGGADGVILATPNALHVDQAMACVARGLPVLVEKPIATRAEDAKTLVDAAAQADVPLLVGHHRRHNPLIQRAKQLIDDGEIGEIRAVQATCWFYKPDSYFEAADWRRKQGAGPVSVNLVHDVDLIRYLCGEVLSVHAMSHPSARGHETEDVAGAVFRLENGGIGVLSVSDGVVSPWSWELTAREHPIYPPTPENCYQIGGSHGALSIPDLRVWRHADGGRDWWSPISAMSVMRDATDPLVNQIENFAAVIRGEAAPVVSGETGWRTLRVIEAIQRSAETGQPADLEDGAGGARIGCG